jgi:hypothetical protein
LTSQLNALAEALETLVARIRASGESFWSQRIEDDLHFIRQGDAYGANRFLTYFGGMGSLNDLILCAENGHKVEKADVSRVNDEVRDLLSRAYQLARSIHSLPPNKSLERTRGK